MCDGDSLSVCMATVSRLKHRAPRDGVVALGCALGCVVEVRGRSARLTGESSVSACAAGPSVPGRGATSRSASTNTAPIGDLFGGLALSSHHADGREQIGPRFAIVSRAVLTCADLRTK